VIGANKPKQGSHNVLRWRAGRGMRHEQRENLRHPSAPSCADTDEQPLRGSGCSETRLVFTALSYSTSIG